MRTFQFNLPVALTLDQLSGGSGYFDPTVCGPPSMVDARETILSRLGCPEQSIIFP